MTHRRRMCTAQRTMIWRFGSFTGMTCIFCPIPCPSESPSDRNSLHIPPPPPKKKLWNFTKVDQSYTEDLPIYSNEPRQWLFLCVKSMSWTFSCQYGCLFFKCLIEDQGGSSLCGICEDITLPILLISFEVKKGWIIHFPTGFGWFSL